MDMRATGASSGSRRAEWDPNEIQDLRAVAAWVARQPWSNGRVGTWGVSYSGAAADMSLGVDSPVLAAAAPWYSDYDVQWDLAMPGGVRNRGMIDPWAASSAGLDANDLCSVANATGWECMITRLFVRGVKPVDADRGGQQLSEVIASRQSPRADLVTAGVEFRDDPLKVRGGPLFFRDISAYSYRDETARIGRPIFAQVGWLDAATVDDALNRYRALPNPHRLVIGPFSHAGGHDTDPFAPADRPVTPSLAAQYARLADFFRNSLSDNPSIKGKSIRYYVNGAGVWKTTSTWPPAGLERQMFYLARGSTLSTTPPRDEGSDRYRVDFSASTGSTNRWVTQLGGVDVIYPDRAAEDRRLLTYTTTPFTEAVEVTGTPELQLYVTSDQSDTAFHVYLEDVAPNGRVTYVTEGILRSTHRKVRREAVPYIREGPQFSFLRTDASPFVRGRVESITIPFIATSTRIAAGHSLRVAIAGADRSMFDRYPSRGATNWTVHRSPSTASRLVLPIRAWR
jgi:putative CocE/NonD family hydrolase